MSEDLSGPYRIFNDTLLREKAARTHDPRHVFYKAMLLSRTYQAYFADVGEVVVEPETYRTRPVTASMEIRYCRRNGWIADA